MIITYVRSSSYGTWQLCNFKYALNYVLGIRETNALAATKGNVSHKALELLARYKLATQRSEATLKDDELGNFNTNEITPESAISLAWNHITGKNPHIDWKQSDFKDCERYTMEALTWKDGLFSPLKREVIVPEQFFDLEISEPWAHYDYVLPNGEKLSGTLRIKGTMDLLVKNGEDMEMIDWKTGARLDWSNFQHKSYEKLMDDFQLLLYYYAVTKLFPKVKNVYVTIFYLKAGGPETLCFTEKDVEKTKRILEQHFNAIRNTVRPKIVYPSRKCNFCDYSKKDLDGNKVSYEDSICNIIHKDVIELGMDRVMTKYGKPGVFSEYSEGGGRSANTINKQERHDGK